MNRTQPGRVDRNLDHHLLMPGGQFERFGDQLVLGARDALGGDRPIDQLRDPHNAFAVLQRSVAFAGDRPGVQRGVGRHPVADAPGDCALDLVEVAGVEKDTHRSGSSRASGSGLQGDERDLNG